MKLKQRTFLILLTAGMGMVAWKGNAQTVDDRIFSVRPDVDLSKRKIGDSVVIRITEALAIQVAKP